MLTCLGVLLMSISIISNGYVKEKKDKANMAKCENVESTVQLFCMFKIFLEQEIDKKNRKAYSPELPPNADDNCYIIQDLIPPWQNSTHSPKTIFI